MRMGCGKEQPFLFLVKGWHLFISRLFFNVLFESKSLRTLADFLLTENPLFLWLCVRIE